jgi:hypothetical protein
MRRRKRKSTIASLLLLALSCPLVATKRTMPRQVTNGPSLQSMCFWTRYPSDLRVSTLLL